MTLPLSFYLDRGKKIKLIPNFFVSEPYLKLSKVLCISYSCWVWIEDDKWLLFPPLNISKKVNYQCPFLSQLKPVWSDFESSIPYLFDKRFLDWEYIFNPTHFNDLIGGKWEVYRKNRRKWPRTHEKWSYSSISHQRSACLLVSEWLEGKEDDIQDAELLAEYILGDQPGVHKKYLYDLDELIAINAWDENWHYINYRFCIIKKGQSYLDEFVRNLFYTDPEIQAKNKLINDGGCLGSSGLERFKDKLNPIKKRAVYSWIK